MRRRRKGGAAAAAARRPRVVPRATLGRRRHRRRGRCPKKRARFSGTSGLVHLPKGVASPGFGVAINGRSCYFQAPGALVLLDGPLRAWKVPFLAFLVAVNGLVGARSSGFVELRAIERATGAARSTLSPLAWWIPFREDIARPSARRESRESLRIVRALRRGRRRTSRIQ